MDFLKELDDQQFLSENNIGMFEGAKANFQYKNMADYITTAHDYPVTNKSAWNQSRKDINMEIETGEYSTDELVKLEDFLGQNKDKWEQLTYALDYKKLKTPPKGVPKDVFSTFVKMFLKM